MIKYILVQSEETAPTIYRARTLSDLLSIVREIDELVGTEMMLTPLSKMSVFSEEDVLFRLFFDEDVLFRLFFDEETQIFVRDEDQRSCWLQTDGTMVPVQP